MRWVGRLDDWMARLLQPPTIKMCHLTGWTHWAFSRYLFWFSYALMGYVYFDNFDWFARALWILVMTVVTVGAALRPDEPIISYLWVRIMLALLAIMITLAMFVPLMVLAAYLGLWEVMPYITVQTVPYWGIVWAEYARTLDTLPPKPEKEKKRKLVESRV